MVLSFGVLGAGVPQDVSRLVSTHVKPAPSLQDRRGSPEALLALLQDRGAVARQSEWRMDFADHYQVAPGFSFLGLDWVAFRHERRKAGDVGCCENPGVALLLRGSKVADARLQRFAEQHACQLDVAFDARRELAFMPSAKRWPDGRYTFLRCDDWTLRDAQLEQP